MDQWLAAEFPSGRQSGDVFPHNLATFIPLWCERDLNTCKPYEIMLSYWEIWSLLGLLMWAQFRGAFIWNQCLQPQASCMFRSYLLNIRSAFLMGRELVIHTHWYNFQKIKPSEFWSNKILLKFKYKSNTMRKMHWFSLKCQYHKNSAIGFWGALGAMNNSLLEDWGHLINVPEMVGFLGFFCFVLFCFVFGHLAIYGVTRSGTRAMAGSLTHCARPGIEPVSQHSKVATNPIVPQWELHEMYFLNTVLMPAFFWGS